jgi:hypothetical protein
VYENIIPGSATDESVALLVVKPLDDSLLFHLSSFLLYCPAKAEVFGVN